ncbi:MAG: hypothetical protein IJP16_06715 [Clostridia bacterium]|nr:hypothetical protein [Clostridia bacterium]
MAELNKYKCPACSASLEFDASSQNIKCPYCDTEFDISVFQTEESHDEMNWDSASGAKWEDGDGDGVSAYVCQSCGGEIISDGNTAATKCPFCDSPIVMTGRLSGDLKPDLVIPFKLDKKAAKAALLRHVSGKKLVPKVFRDENRIDEIRGIYVPFWIHNADANGHINYRTTRVRHWSDSRYNYTETTHYRVTRGGSMRFEHVPIDASSKIANDIMESIEPFDFSEAVDFETAYLAGYLADKYDVEADVCRERINQRVKRSVEDTFRQTVNGYATVTTESSSVSLENTEVKYVLYPVWLLNTTWNGNRYTFAMNGQTGKFVGNLPLDKGAWWRWFLGVSGITAAIASLISVALYFI